MKREITDGKIVVRSEIPIDEASLRRGLDAANAEFKRVGVTPYRAAVGHFDREGAMMTGRKVKQKDIVAGNAWLDAQWAALAAVFGKDADPALIAVDLNSDYRASQ